MSFWSGRKVLIAGGAGFMGSHVADSLLEQGVQVTIVDNLERGSQSNLQSVIPRVRFEKVDLRNCDAATQIAKGHDIILNFAAKVAGVTYNYTHHSEALLDNLLISSSLLKAAVGVNAERILTVSSSAVYPYDSPLPTSEREADRRCFGAGEEGYSWSKYVGELQAKYCARETPLKVAIVRPFNVYGPRDPADGAKAHVIPAIIRQALQFPQKLVVAGTGSQTRSFLYVSDAVKAMLRVVERRCEAEPLNIGSSREVSIKELVEIILKIIGHRAHVCYDSSLPQGNPRKCPDVGRFVELFGEPPDQVPLERGLETTIEWFRSSLDSSGPRRLE